jgi:hypothetical protein
LLYPAELRARIYLYDSSATRSVREGAGLEWNGILAGNCFHSQHLRTRMLHLKAKKTSSSCRISQSLEIPPPQNRDHTPVKAKNQITLFPDFVRSFDDQQTMIDGTIRIHVETGLFFIFQQNASVKNKAHQFGVVAPETAMNQQALSFY